VHQAVPESTVLLKKASDAIRDYTPNPVLSVMAIFPKLSLAGGLSFERTW